MNGDSTYWHVRGGIPPPDKLHPRDGKLFVPGMSPGWEKQVEVSPERPFRPGNQEDKNGCRDRKTFIEGASLIETQTG